MARRRARPGRIEHVQRDRCESPSAPKKDDFLSLFSDALSVIAVAQWSLASKELRGTGDEVVALRYALSLLQAAYSGLDLASGQLRRTSRGAR